MIDSAQIDSALRTLAEAAGPARILVFGSYARGGVRAGSHLDFPVIEPRLADRAHGMVRLRGALRPLRPPVEVLVYSAEEVERWGRPPGGVLYRAPPEGRVFFG